MSKLSEFLTVVMVVIITAIVVAKSGFIVLAPKPSDKICVTPISLPAPPLQRRIELPKSMSVPPAPVRKPRPPVRQVKPVGPPPPEVFPPCKDFFCS